MKELAQKEEALKMYNYGDCFFCGGEVKENIVELDYRYKGELFIFRMVPAGVCRQCGEKYLVSEVANSIEQKIRAGEKGEKTIQVPVLEFSELAR